MSQTNQPNRWSLFELSATYCQDSDCNEPRDPGQELRVTAESNGSGQFLTLSTHRWALSGPGELQALLADFISRGAGLPLEQMAVATAPEAIDPAQAVYEQLLENESLLWPAAVSVGTYLCDACGHDGGLAFDDCTQPGCKGMFLASRPPMGPHLAHEYGFGKPAGPYPVEAIDMSKVEVTREEPTTAPPVETVAPVDVVPLSVEARPKVIRSGVTPRRWSEAEDAQVLREYASRPTAELATELNRSAHAIELRYGMLKKRPVPSTDGPRPAMRAEAPAEKPAPQTKIDPALRTQVRQKAKAIVKKKEEQAKKKPEPAVTAAFIRSLSPHDPARRAYELDGIRGYEAHQRGEEVRRA